VKLATPTAMVVNISELNSGEGHEAE